MCSSSFDVNISAITFPKNREVSAIYKATKINTTPKIIIWTLVLITGSSPIASAPRTIAITPPIEPIIKVTRISFKLDFLIERIAVTITSQTDKIPATSKK